MKYYLSFVIHSAIFIGRMHLDRSVVRSVWPLRRRRRRRQSRDHRKRSTARLNTCWPRSPRRPMARSASAPCLLETGDAAYLDRQGHFAMQSVYKLPIAMALAQSIDRRTYDVDTDISITPADYVRRGFHSPIRNLNPRGTVMRLDDIVRYSLSESRRISKRCPAAACRRPAERPAISFIDRYQRTYRSPIRPRTSARIGTRSIATGQRPRRRSICCAI